MFCLSEQLNPLINIILLHFFQTDVCPTLGAVDAFFDLTPTSCLISAQSLDDLSSEYSALGLRQLMEELITHVHKSKIHFFT